jgi:hypothetical protein
MQLGSMFINNCNNIILSIIEVNNKQIAKLHHVGSLYILTYVARKIKHKIHHNYLFKETKIDQIRSMAATTQ